MIHDQLQTKTTVQLVVFLSIQGQMHNYHFFLCNDHFNNNWIPGQMFFLYREGLQQQVWPWSKSNFALWGCLIGKIWKPSAGAALFWICLVPKHWNPWAELIVTGIVIGIVIGYKIWRLTVDCGLWTMEGDSITRTTGPEAEVFRRVRANACSIVNCVWRVLLFVGCAVLSHFSCVFATVCLSVLCWPPSSWCINHPIIHSATYADKWLVQECLLPFFFVSLCL